MSLDTEIYFFLKIFMTKKNLNLKLNLGYRLVKNPWILSVFFFFSLAAKETMNYFFC